MNFLDGAIYGTIVLALAGILGWIQNRGIQRGRAIERAAQAELATRRNDVRQEGERLKVEALERIDEEHTPTIDEVKRDQATKPTPAVVNRLLARYREAKAKKP